MIKFKNMEDLKVFLSSNLLTSYEVADIVGCTRQHISKLVKSGQLVPVKKHEKLNIFLKSDVLQFIEEKNINQ